AKADQTEAGLFADVEVGTVHPSELIVELPVPGRVEVPPARLGHEEAHGRLQQPEDDREARGRERSGLDESLHAWRFRVGRLEIPRGADVTAAGGGARGAPRAPARAGARAAEGRGCKTLPPSGGGGRRT